MLPFGFAGGKIRFSVSRLPRFVPRLRPGKDLFLLFPALPEKDLYSSLAFFSATPAAPVTSAAIAISTTAFTPMEASR